MTWLQAVVLGVVQGLTEFLPISSSAHLILVPWLCGWKDQGLTFDVVLHGGTLLAILGFFWRDWLGMLESIWNGNNLERIPPGVTRRTLPWIILGTLPAAFAGFFAQSLVETQLRSPLILSMTLSGVALLLWIAEKRAKLKKGLSEVSLVDALAVGTAQALALVPGTSRSGITITAGLFRGLTREAAARFSFLLSAPIIAGATLKKLLDLRESGIADADVAPLLLGFLAALVTGYLTIRFLLRFLQRYTLFVFIYYRIVLGVVILLLIRYAGFRP
ncbi:MAG: undecaprenyl-diphosphatase UppP [Acidobacteriota bacterium]